MRSKEVNRTAAGKPVITWLLTGCILIFCMVIIGGITRLTHSGLSMVEWNLLLGSLPPFSAEAWQEVFDKYKQFPEYQQVNTHFTLDEFKSIYWWEYIHRFLGRLIGIVFIIPFIVFMYRKMLSKAMINKLWLLLFLGGFQGFLGWFMVKSGLSKDPDVSHYRLALHLITAFITFGYTLWLALDIHYNNQEAGHIEFKGLKKLLQVFFALTTIQVIYGAFVAGLNAGFIYNTFPKMGSRWIAEAVIAMEPLYLNFIEGIAGVQFIHRYIAVLLVIVMIFIWIKARKLKLNISQHKAINFLAIILSIQFLLGIFTLIYAVPVIMGVLHQSGAFLLFAGCVYALHRFSINS